MYPQSSKYRYKNAVVSSIQTALTISGYEDEEPFSHVSVDTLSPKITGILCNDQ